MFQALELLLKLLPDDVVPNKGLGELDIPQMIDEWDMASDPEAPCL